MLKDIMQIVYADDRKSLNKPDHCIQESLLWRRGVAVVQRKELYHQGQHPFLGDSAGRKGHKTKQRATTSK